MGAMLSHTGILEWQRTRSASGCGNWEFGWPSARSARKCYRQRWGGRSNAGFWLASRIGPRNLGVLASIVYQTTPRDPLVLAGVVLAMLSLGLLATWIPARLALSLDPLTLLRGRVSANLGQVTCFDSPPKRIAPLARRNGHAPGVRGHSDFIGCPCPASAISGHDSPCRILPARFQSQRKGLVQDRFGAHADLLRGPGLCA